MWLLETPPVIPTHCPACFPDLAEDYVVLWCGEHQPDISGEVDALAKAAIGQDYLNGGGESGGVDNRTVCALIHGTGAA